MECFTTTFLDSDLLKVLGPPFCTLTLGQTGLMKMIDEHEVGLAHQKDYIQIRPEGLDQLCHYWDCGLGKAPSVEGG